MSKYVPDILSHRWVIISSKRLDRPSDDFSHKSKNACHFCEGQEKLSPNEVLRYGKGEKDKPGWTVRVVPNKYPITDFHEVIIHSPDCNKDMDQLELAHIELIFKAYRERYNYYLKKGQVLIFCNHGEHAGASIEHPHSQLVVIPNQINLDTLVREPLNNLVKDDKYCNVYCPDFSQWPYEVWIAPKAEGQIFGNSTDDELKAVAMHMQHVIRELKVIHKKSPWADQHFGYNYYIYPKENWYIRIIPRFVFRAGFELGTGLQVNIIDPKDAALELKGLTKKMDDVMNKLKNLSKK